MSELQVVFEYVDGAPPFVPRRCVVEIPARIPSGQRPAFLRMLGVFLIREAERRRSADQARQDEQLLAE